MHNHYTSLNLAQKLKAFGFREENYDYIYIVKDDALVTFARWESIEY